MCVAMELLLLFYQWFKIYLLTFVISSAMSNEPPKVQINNDLEKKIAEAFEIFDHSGKQMVDVREIGTIMRSLGCCPSEEEIQEVLMATEEKEATGSVHLANFLPYMCQKITEHRFYPADAETLLAAFKVLEDDNKERITKEKITKLIMEEGEQFTQEEYDEMMQVALDVTTDTIPFEHYINQLMPTSTILYDIADAIEAAKPKEVKKKTLLELAMEAEAEAEAENQ